MVDETGKVTFNEQEQAEVNRVISERLARDGVQDKNEIVDLLKDFDYKGTPAEIKAVLKVQAETFKQQKAELEKQAEIDSAKAEASLTGTSPELIAEMKQLRVDLAEIKQKDASAQKAKEDAVKASEAKTTADKAAADSYTEACDEYGAEVVDQLAKDEDFLDYIGGKVNVAIKTLVEKFLKLKGKAYEEGLTKANSKASRSTGSGSGKLDTGTYGLTSDQQSLAKENNMPLKEYAEALHQLPGHKN